MHPPPRFLLLLLPQKDKMETCRSRGKRRSNKKERYYSQNFEAQSLGAQEEMDRQGTNCFNTKMKDLRAPTRCAPVAPIILFGGGNLSVLLSFRQRNLFHSRYLKKGKRAWTEFFKMPHRKTEAQRASKLLSSCQRENLGRREYHNAKYFRT